MKKWKKLLSVAMAACLSVAVFAGCGGKEASRDTLRVGVTNFADSLEPTENAFGWVVMRYGMGETLTKFDEKMNIQPWLAESWKISDDKLTWTA